jgi:hypothetical protein
MGRFGPVAQGMRRRKMEGRCGEGEERGRNSGGKNNKEKWKIKKNRRILPYSQDSQRKRNKKEG